jgi:predicted nucleic acid-binding protein
MVRSLLDTDIWSEYLKGYGQTVVRTKAAATTKATARKQGSILELPDCLIAAVAVRLDLPLVTGDFGAIQRTGSG